MIAAPQSIMSDAQPIDPVRFAQALESLPVDALFSKAAELTNSIAHLHSSNQQMLPFAEEGDSDCREAMFENLSVIGRMNERIELIKIEVQSRGLRWYDEEVQDAQASRQVEAPDAVNMANGEEQLVNGHAQTVVTSNDQQALQSGSLSDAELQRRLQDIMPDDEGVHL